MRPWLWAALLALAGCASEIADPSVFEDEAICDLDVQQDILVPRCALAGCHVPTSPTGGIEWVSAGLPDRLVGVEATTCVRQQRVNPSAIDESHLLIRISESPRCGTDVIERMPKDLPPLSEHEIACVRDWIRDMVGEAP
jgi:hypothetical protein